MSGTKVPGTAVPIPSFTDRGFIVPQQSEIVTGINSDWNGAFGGNLNLAPNTPQGQLIASQAALLGALNDQMVAMFNGVDPMLASGIMQDAIGEIYFIQRLPAQATGITVDCGGGAGVVIPENAYVTDNNNNVYFNTSQGTIAPNGHVSLQFACTQTGPIPVPATVTIFTVVPQWNTAVVTAGVIGNNVERRTQFELRRSRSVSINGQSTLSTIYAVVAAVPEVLELFVIDNPQPTNTVIGGLTLPPNSIYVCVAGGFDPNAVAAAIYSKKPVGIPYFPGNTTVNVQDPNPIYIKNGTYIGPFTPVVFETAIGAPVCFNVTIYSPSVNSTVPSDAATQVGQAIQNAFTGVDPPGSIAASIGSIIFASQPYITAINDLGSWAQVVSISVGVGLLGTINAGAGNIAAFTGSIAGTTLTVSGGVTGTIAIGMFVFGANVLPGTIINSGSGSTWVVSTSQTVTSTALTTVSANLTAVSMQINWVPTLQNADVNLTLTSVP